MGNTFNNGANTPLNLQSASVPNMASTLVGWFQAITFGVVTKVIIASQVVETVVETNFRGTVQPFTDTQLLLKPEGQRSWSWQWVHSDPTLVLKSDDIIIYLGIQYRVMGLKDFSLYGYLEYQLCQDFSGSGPEVSP